MSGVIRFIALAALAGGIAGCITDGIEAETQAAKPRVIDTPKTRAASAKKDPTKSAAVRAEGDTGSRSIAARIEPDTKPDETKPTTTAARTPNDGTLIPAHSLFGNWTLGAEVGNRK
jgi:hypothetical protein